MPQKNDNTDRDARIVNEIIVDSYGDEEIFPAWHTYLSSHLKFPFSARCIEKLPPSPLHLGEEVQVLKMASDRKCMSNMFVLVKWQDRQFSVPLEQLQGINVDKSTLQAIEDWHYWFKDTDEYDDEDEYGDED